MDFLTGLLIAVGLAMDAFAVSLAAGFVSRGSIRRPTAIRAALFFGIFQAMMPVLGWALGKSFSSLIQDYDHWVAFGLLFAIGAKMIYEGIMIEDVEEKNLQVDRLSVVIVLAIATSIDALAVGLSFSVLQIDILYPVLLIGIVTFILSGLGFLIGKKSGHFLEKKIEILGGVILIGIGLRILVEHLINDI